MMMEQVVCNNVRVDFVLAIDLPLRSLANSVLCRACFLRSSHGEDFPTSFQKSKIAISVNLHYVVSSGKDQTR